MVQAQKQFIEKSKVEDVLISSRKVLSKYINDYAKEKALNNKLESDNSKLKDALRAVSESSKKSDKSLLEQSMKLFEKSVEEAERLVIEYSKELDNTEVDDLLKELGLTN